MFSVACSPSVSTRPCWHQRAANLVSMTTDQLPVCPRTLWKWTPVAHVCCGWRSVSEIYPCRCVSAADRVYCWVVSLYECTTLGFPISLLVDIQLFPDSGAFLLVVWKMLVSRNIMSVTESHTHSEATTACDRAPREATGKDVSPVFQSIVTYNKGVCNNFCSDWQSTQTFYAEK